MRLKIPISNGWAPTLSRWASEIRSKDFLTDEDITLESFEPNPRGFGTMALASASINILFANFIREPGQKIWFTTQFSFTTTGVATSIIEFDVPILGALPASFHCTINDTVGGITGSGIIGVENRTVQVRRYDGGNWGIGAGRLITCTGTYRRTDG